MTGQLTTRQCGNCEQEIGVDDVLCPHCGVLLAAYEAPSGAIAGTAAAINPVSMAPESSHEEIVATPPATTPQAPYVSPIAEALHQTRVAVDLDTLDDRFPEVTPVPPTASPSRATEQHRIPGAPSSPVIIPDINQPPAPSQAIPEPPHEERQSITRERVRAQAEAVENDVNSEIRDIASRATRSSSNRPTPEQRAAHHDPPVRPPSHTTSPRRTQSPSVGSIIALFVIVLFAMRIVGSSALAGFLVLPIIIIGLIWLMVTIAKNTGRKTTSMPRDRDRRK